MKSLSDVTFSNSFTSQFPGEFTNDATPRSTPKVLFSTVNPQPVKQPKILLWSNDLSKRLGLSTPPTHSDAEILSGNQIPESSTPYAACYGGHQFGNWAGQLGDGRAINLGEITDPQNKLWEIQLKGAGRTAYSRGADGRAVLRSSFREFIASEAMHHLGVPTTRALSLVDTGESVSRDMFYDGNVRAELGAITSRVAESFVRFGNFEILAAQQEKALLHKLMSWVVDRHYSHLSGKVDLLPLFFQEVCSRTAHMIAEWLRVGFVHGVMNTDNMSILGQTIDYGPYGWLESYDPLWTPNTTDLPGRRYCFAAQAPIAHWNLQRLGESLTVIGLTPSQLEEGLRIFRETFTEKYFKNMARKLGLKDLNPEEHKDFITELDQLMKSLELDYTLFFRALMKPSSSFESVFSISYKNLNVKEKESLFAWAKKYSDLLAAQTIQKDHQLENMKAANPAIVPRNFQLFEAYKLYEEKEDSSLMEKLFEKIQNPYEEPTEYDLLSQKRPDWAEDQPGSSTLSCSS